MIKTVLEKDRNIIKKDFLKRLLATLIIITNIFFYMPTVTFAEDNDDEKVSATVPAVANEIISKYVNTTSNSSSNSKSSDNSKSSLNTENKPSSNSMGTGEAKIDDSFNINNGGYASIFTSSTTGRQFKEYKQNIDGWDNKYPITNTYWKQECGLVSSIIVGSGYTNEATFEDAAQKLNSTDGKTLLETWLSEYVGQSVSDTSISESELKSNLQAGGVAVVHTPQGSTSWGHWMTILDYDASSNQVYVSNPWNEGSPSGWTNISNVVAILDKGYYITNDGLSVDYGAGSSLSGSSSASSVNMSGNIVENGRNGYKLNIDWDKEIEGMLEKLKEENFKLEKYLAKSIQKEYLKNMIKAAIVTQYPDLRTADEIAKDSEIPADETQGCIKIKRYIDEETKNSFVGTSLTNPIDSKDEDNGMYLSYMPYNEFSKLISSSDASAINYFSLDSSNNLVVSGWETSEVEISIAQTGGDPDPNPDPVPAARNTEYTKLTEKKVNYINQVSNYGMQFSLLWSLLVYGNDENFVNDLAKLVIDTEIVIAATDATNVKVTTYTNTYVKQVVTENTANVGQYQVGEGYAQGSSSNGYQTQAQSTTTKNYTYTVTEKHTLKTDTPSLKVKYADTWTAVYNNNYRIKKEESEEEDTKDLEDNLVSFNTDYNDNQEEIENIVNGDQQLQENIEQQLETIAEETHKENEEFAYRYEILNKVYTEDYNWNKGSNDYIDLLYDEDVQNFIINMIIDQNSEDYIETTFSENATIKRCAKKISETNYLDIQSDAAACVKRLVSESIQISDENATSLRDKLTKQGQDMRKNLVYSSEVTSINTEEDIKDIDRQETIKVEKTTATVEEETTSGDNLRFKKNKDADENSFVKLLYYSKSAKGNLKIIDSWFFESMEETAAIADMEDLIKYLFHLVYQNDYGITDERIQELLNLFDPGKMSSVSQTQTAAGTVVGGASYFSLSLSDEEMEIVYRLVEAEDGSGNDENQKHHACVIYNRLLSSAYPDNISEFVDPGQFAVCAPGGAYWTCVPSQKTIDNCNAALAEGDSTGGAIGFVNIWYWEELGGEGNTKLTSEPAIELFREIEPVGDAVYFTTETIKKELALYASNTSSNASGTAQTIINAARSKIGCPYVWGGNGPNSFDCSGLVCWSYEQAGINIWAHRTSLGSDSPQDVSVSEAQPGDVLYRPGHVALCVSNTNGVLTYIHAPQTGDVVKEVSTTDYSTFSKACRWIQ